MEGQRLEQIIHLISKGDTSAVELLFNKPGGRKYLESIIMVVITSLPSSDTEKSDLFLAFIKALNKIEKRIERQKEGQKVLKQLFSQA